MASSVLKYKVFGEKIFVHFNCTTHGERLDVKFAFIEYIIKIFIKIFIILNYSKFVLAKEKPFFKRFQKTFEVIIGVAFVLTALITITICYCCKKKPPNSNFKRQKFTKDSSVSFYRE